ncbi:HTH-type transcriptional regulator NorG [Granulosicoccus antarcticus IMCC3135]|uniref:HTH-type transcriptional regulator NorG n=2 Tax=Granulosicoccus TaxID=437504 RepID=A0A2Z2NX79_9GAMM|nr:HTH-type transcriptional regulator NorG [Granulosicoccus antarcticus IMCC3135]
MAAVHERIAARTLTPGSRLPSIREFAQCLGVSKSTVVEAYERLRADGVIQSRPGAGYYVSAPLAPLSLSRTEPCRDRDIDPLWITRQSLDAAHDTLKPGCGWMPPSWMPEASLRRALRKVARSTGNALADYAPAQGLAPLRELLSHRLANISINTAAADILLTESGTQAIDLMCRCLLENGDTVLVDDPCYFNFHALLKAHGAHVISVPYTATGPDISLFENALKTHRPRLYITNSGVHNPTGATLSTDTALRVVKLAEQYDLRIVEDDIFTDFEQSPAVRLAALDGLQRVCLIGSFSKTISASIRCGFIAAPASWVEELLDLKIATSFGSGNLAAHITLAILKDGAYRKHVESLRQRLSDQRIRVAQRLATMNILPWLTPQAGLYLWCQLPNGIDAAAVARKALADHVVLAPGNAFSLSHDFSDFMRFNVTQTHDETVYQVLEAAMSDTPQNEKAQ